MFGRVPLAVLVLVIGGLGLAGCSRFQDGAEPARGREVVLIEAAGPDEPPPGQGARTSRDIVAPLAPLPTSVQVFYDPIYLDEWHEQARAKVAAEAAATQVSSVRQTDQFVAANAIRQWGYGQLLLSLPSIGVTAAASGMSYERDGTPATPNSPWGVAWYTFSSYPGSGGNAVFSGHVDWYTGQPAVFGGLRNIGAGDAIYTVLSDGTPIAYQVAYATWVRPETADVAAIFGHTGRDAVTIITCGGTWDARAQDYSHRLIVRAYRVR